MPLPRSPASEVSHDPPQHASEIAHRILTAHARPVGKRCACKHHRPGEVRRHCRRHHDLPAGLAVADQHRLPRPVGVPFSDDANEMDLRATNILDRLPWLRVGRKSDEIGGMARAQRHTDFAVMLHAADARPVTRPRVKDDEWSFGRIGFDARRRANSDERTGLSSRRPSTISSGSKLRTCGASRLLVRDNRYPARAARRERARSARNASRQ